MIYKYPLLKILLIRQQNIFKSLGVKFMKPLKQIGNFKLYRQKPNTLSKGYLYIGYVNVDVKNVDKKRLVRIYLPSDYEFDNPNKRFPVMYMMDAKNLFDEYTSYVGEWHVDETIENRIKEKKKSFIVVGIDSAKKDLLKFYDNMITKPKFMCIITGNFTSVVKDKESGIYIVPITALKP